MEEMQEHHDILVESYSEVAKQSDLPLMYIAVIVVLVMQLVTVVL